MVFFILKRLRSGMVSTYTVKSCSPVARSTPTSTHIAAMSTPVGIIRCNEMDKQNARLARESGVSAREKSALAESLDDQGADCKQRHGDCDRRNRRDLLPPAGGGARCLGQRGHDSLLDANWSHAAAEHLALGVDPGPELDLR